jgi:hypothetical protein
MFRTKKATTVSPFTGPGRGWSVMGGGITRDDDRFKDQRNNKKGGGPLDLGGPRDLGTNYASAQTSNYQSSDYYTPNTSDYQYAYDGVKPSTGRNYDYMNAGRKPVSSSINVGTEVASTSKSSPEYITTGYTPRDKESTTGGEVSGTAGKDQNPYSAIFFIIAGIVILGFIGFVGWQFYKAFTPDEEEEENKDKDGKKEKKDDPIVRRLCMYDYEDEEHCLTNLHALKVLNGEEPLHIYMPLNETGATSHHTEEESQMRTQIDQYDSRFRMIASDLSEVNRLITELNQAVFRSD